MPVFAQQNNQCDRDGKGEPWPNLVIEVAYSESEQHVLNKVKIYWLGNFSRVHDNKYSTGSRIVCITINFLIL
ncbi:hypothetical protein Glove_330g112 [Diversispora epigaea]|uniref:Uncharacterized protein n=1 Tax=Diversispora epigaea TaxID=1348612 RepID=A0A397HMT2_9GLOM|nr:hypothetical protein Glove_330g112 [Diversispora epigaea]